MSSATIDILPTPAIRPRDQRFGRGTTQARWWLGNDAYATAFYNALSITFPRGEAFFVESVRAFRDDTPPKLQSEINAFIKQEVNHSREHVAFNTRAESSGYDMSGLETEVIRILARTKGRPPIIDLAATMALEHFTALFAHQLLTHPAHLAHAAAHDAALWHWHAVEEIEHKGVAYDTWLHATRDWSRWKRWKLKSLMMLIASYNFVTSRTSGMVELLRQDGLTGSRVMLKLVWYAFGNPGMVRRIIPGWISYFMPGFHPWKQDDRALIALYDSAYADAIMPMLEAAE
jgi:predicted metal-dependent hydrolase